MDKNDNGWLPISHATARFHALDQMNRHRRRHGPRRSRGLRGVIWALLIRIKH